MPGPGRNRRHQGFQLKIPLTMFSVSVTFPSSCFSCNQCLEPFPAGDFFPSPDGTKIYCEADYFQLYGDRCARCGDVVMERVVTALDLKWHSHHFTCDLCGIALAGTSYFKRNDRPFCKDCNTKLKLQGRSVLKQHLILDQELQKSECPRCKKPILPAHPSITLQGVKYHLSHYNCSTCKKTLDPTSYKELDGKLYCAEDFLLATAPICYVCKKPIFMRRP